MTSIDMSSVDMTSIDMTSTDMLLFVLQIVINGQSVYSNEALIVLLSPLHLSFDCCCDRTIQAYCGTLHNMTEESYRRMLFLWNVI
jgi:hypothetical protein